MFARLISVAAVLLTIPTVAGDWPQILGPHRDGVADKEQIAERLPATLPPLWTRPVGDGFAGIAVAGNRAVLFHRSGTAERVECLAAATGTTLWTSDAETGYSGAIVSDAGPRCVPVITQDRVIVYGAEGLLRCLDLRTGKEIWSNATRENFGVLAGYFGAGSTPLVDDGRVIVNVGGSRKQAGVVAFALDTGKVLWTATSEQASYSSPIVATIGGQRQVIVLARLNCVGLDPATGRVLWSVPFGARGPTVNAANPVLRDDMLLLTASYGIGAAAFRLTVDKADELWRSPTLLASQYTTPIFHDGLLYGIDGRQDVGTAALVCLDPATQSERWRQTNFGYASLILVDSTLLAQTTDGVLVVIQPDPTKYREIGRTALLPGTTRALPALSQGRYFLRNESTLGCFSFSPTR